MSWAKLDDQFIYNRKALLAGKDGRMLYLTALCYSAGQLTDGRIDDGLLPMLGALAEVDEARQVAGQLVEIGLFERIEGGYQIHHYSEYNPSAEQVKAQRAADAKRKAEWRQQHRQPDGQYTSEWTDGGTPSGQTSGGTTVPSPSPSPSPYPVPAPDSFARNDSEPETSKSASSAELAGDASETAFATQNEATKTKKPVTAKPKPNALDNVPPRPDQLMYSALVAALGDPLTLSARGVYNKKGKELRDAGVLPEEIPRLVTSHRQRWKNIDVTAHSLAKNLAILRQPIPEAKNNGNGNRPKENIRTGYNRPRDEIENYFAQHGSIPPGCGWRIEISASGDPVLAPG
jgi:hypothetical protein